MFLIEWISHLISLFEKSFLQSSRIASTSKLRPIKSENPELENSFQRYWNFENISTNIKEKFAFDTNKTYNSIIIVIVFLQLILKR